MSHSIDEILRSCRAVTVLRDGRATLDSATERIDAPQLVRAITGRAAPPAPAPAERAPRADGVRAPALTVRGLRSRTVRRLDLAVRPGEVCGITGDLESGAADVLPALYGVVPCTATIAVDGRELATISPRACRRSGIAYVPADRGREGVLPGMTVRENLTGGEVAGVARRAIIQRPRERALATELIRRFDIRPPTPERLIEQLSGGNQQKAMLARWFRLRPSVVLLQEPTQGIDVGARDQILAQVRGAAAQGAAVLIGSTDVSDLVRLCHRVVVMRAGGQAAVLSGSHLTVAELRHAIYEGM